ncbi:MazG-like family protein [Salinicoccus sp. Marseille-QA3877]
MNITELTRKIEVWAIDRNLHTADSSKQALKLGEEFGELCEALAKGNRNMLKDSLGDMYVVMTILAMQERVDVKACVEMAYEEIKDRKGKMIDGVFVKEGDY